MFNMIFQLYCLDEETKNKAFNSFGVTFQQQSFPMTSWKAIIFLSTRLFLHFQLLKKVGIFKIVIVTKT